MVEAVVVIWFVVPAMASGLGIGLLVGRLLFQNRYIDEILALRAEIDRLRLLARLGVKE